MRKDCWNRIEEIFGQALTLEPENRREFIKSECGADEELLNELITLVENHEIPSNFLDDPVFSLGLKLLKTNRTT
jgi:predicted oxidoreductase